MDMEIEDGVIWVCGAGVMAFTDFGIESLVELIKMWVGALSIVDAAHGPPPYARRCCRLGRGYILLFSGYKIFGPRVGVTAVRAGLLDRLRYYRLAPAASVGCGKAEQDTQKIAGIAALRADLDLIASLGEPHESLLQQLTSAMSAFACHEEHLTNMLLEELTSVPGVGLARAPAGVASASTVASPRQVAVRSTSPRHAMLGRSGSF
jgi:selenocysteine lyase/cysteine desulfurase